MRFCVCSCILTNMKRSEAIDQLREMDAKYSCYVYCKNELAVVLGLCVGHDTVFYKACRVPVTTLAVKDRVLGHNPIAAVTCPYVRKRVGKARNKP